MEDTTSTFEARVQEAEAALDSLPVPDPPSSRQVVIAARRKILDKVKSHGWKQVHATFVSLGHEITLETFKDYVYKGGASKLARTAEKERVKRKMRSSINSSDQSSVSVPAQATQATAGGRPVVGHKLV